MRPAGRAPHRARRRCIAKSRRCRQRPRPAATGSSIEPDGTMIAQRTQASRVERDRFVDQRPEHIQHGGDRDGARSIEIVRLLRRGAREIDVGRAGLRVDARCARRSPGRCRVRSGSGRRASGGSRAACSARRCPARGACTAVRLRVRARASRVPVRACPARVGGELRAQVGEVVREIPRRPATAAQQLADERFVQHTVAHDATWRDQRAFFADVATARRHRPRRDAADVRMVRARRGEEFERRGHRRRTPATRRSCPAGACRRRTANSAGTHRPGAARRRARPARPRRSRPSNPDAPACAARSRRGWPRHRTARTKNRAVP